MAKDRIESALEALTSLWNTSALMIVAWLLFVPGAIERLRSYNAALDLTAWKILVTLAEQLPVEGSGEYLQQGYVKTSPQEGFVGQPPPRYSSPLLGMICHDVELDDSPPGQSCRPLVVQASWPERRQIGVFLSTEYIRPPDDFSQGRWMPESFSKLTHFRVITTPTVLPMSSYLISRVTTTNSTYVVHNREDSWTKVGLSEWPLGATMPFSRPLRESDILSYAGVSDVRNITDDLLRRFQQEADLSGGVTVTSLNLNVGFALAGIGLLLAIVGFLMLAPLQARAAAEEDCEPPMWTLAMGTRGRVVLEVCILAVWVLWASAPLAIAATQLLVFPLLPLSYRLLAGVGLLGLSFTTVMFLRCIAVMRRFRRIAGRLRSQASA